jgi:hypothetical protein
LQFNGGETSRRIFTIAKKKAEAICLNAWDETRTFENALANQLLNFVIG